MSKLANDFRTRVLAPRLTEKKPSADTGGASVRSSLAGLRQSIQDSISTAGGTSSTPTSMTVLKTSPVNTFAADQETDPLKKALEAKYATDVASAQQGVQDATLAPSGDPIFGSVGQSMAKSQRMMKMAQAARDYNRGLAIGDPRRKSEELNSFYGA